MRPETVCVGHVCRYLCMYIHRYICNEKSTESSRCSAQERDFIQSFQDVPHGSAIFDEKSTF